MEAPGQTRAWTELAAMEDAIVNRLTDAGHFQWAGYACGKRDAYLKAVELLERVDRPSQALAKLADLRAELVKDRDERARNMKDLQASRGYVEGVEKALDYVRNRLRELMALRAPSRA